VASVVLSVSLAPVYVVATGMAVSAAPERHAGRASALLETCTNLGGALGIAVLGSIAGLVFRARMSRPPPAAVPLDVWHAAGGTLGRAVDVARDLPGAGAGALLDAAHAAFGAAFQTTQFLGAAMLLAAAITAVVLLPSRSGPGRDDS